MKKSHIVAMHCARTNYNCTLRCSPSSPRKILVDTHVLQAAAKMTKTLLLFLVLSAWVTTYITPSQNTQRQASSPPPLRALDSKFARRGGDFRFQRTFRLLSQRLQPFNKLSICTFPSTPLGGASGGYFRAAGAGSRGRLCFFPDVPRPPSFSGGCQTCCEHQREG
ncbi:hypothetical protein NXF25_001645 [Crotalus adamanteus]|uniref:Uncharacterized protein n=1 Tax=Crotalus adamanteus TaxID=8729 RepID=A0AAW1C830_CROAD